MKKSTVYSLQSTAISNSEAETMGIAMKFAKTLRGGEVVLLEGDLGSGKTTFVRGMARAFGILEPIRSPTFTLMHIHRIKPTKLQTTNYKLQTFVHVDAYRLKTGRDLRAIGLEEYIGKNDTVVVIEWGGKAHAFVHGRKSYRLTFTFGAYPHKRYITIYDRTKINP